MKNKKINNGKKRLSHEDFDTERYRIILNEDYQKSCLSEKKHIQEIAYTNGFYLEYDYDPNSCYELITTYNFSEDEINLYYEYREYGIIDSYAFHEDELNFEENCIEMKSNQINPNGYNVKDGHIITEWSIYGESFYNDVDISLITEVFEIFQKTKIVAGDKIYYYCQPLFVLQSELFDSKYNISSEIVDVVITKENNKMRLIKKLELDKNFLRRKKFKRIL